MYKYLALIYVDPQNQTSSTHYISNPFSLFATEPKKEVKNPPFMEASLPKLTTRRSEQQTPVGLGNLPKSPRVPMEFLSRSWSASALEVSKALSQAQAQAQAQAQPPCMNSKSTHTSTTTTTASIPENVAGESENTNQFYFATSAATSQLVLDRIMSQSMREEVSPLTSGRLSHSSGPLIAGGSFETDSLPVSPSEEFDDVVKFFRNNNSINHLFNNGSRSSAGVNGCSTPATGGSKTIGRWLKDRKEKKKEETRVHNAEVHAAVSVAAVAAAIAAIAAATAASSSTTSSRKNNEQVTKTDMAVASAATLVAAQCAEAAEAMGAEHDHLTTVVSSAVNVHSHDDITTLTAAAATALRGAATLKARAMKEVWNIAAVIPVEKGMGIGVCGKANTNSSSSFSSSEELLPAPNSFLGASSDQDLLAKGTELLKRTRKGDLHWKVVSVYIHRTGQVMLKMKSKHVAGTFTKKKKNVILEVRRNMPAWPGRHLFEGGDQHRYFGLKTESRGVVEFECRNQREHDIWTRGVSRLLSIVAERKNMH